MTDIEEEARKASLYMNDLQRGLVSKGHVLYSTLFHNCGEPCRLLVQEVLDNGKVRCLCMGSTLVVTQRLCDLEKDIEAARQRLR